MIAKNSEAKRQQQAAHQRQRSNAKDEQKLCFLCERARPIFAIPNDD